MDIVKLVSQFVTPGALSQIATLLGISQADVQKGLGAAVPGVLASLLGAAQRPGAADALGAALTRATGEGGLATMLGRDPAAAAAAGSGVLGSLLGGGEGKLAEALGSYTGLSRSAGGALLGLAGSMALGALGGEAKAKGTRRQGRARPAREQQGPDQGCAALGLRERARWLGAAGRPRPAGRRARRPAAGGDHAAEGRAAAHPAAGGDHTAERRAAAHPADAGPPPRHELALVADRGAYRHLAALALPGSGPRAGHRGDRAATGGNDDGGPGARTRGGPRGRARDRTGPRRRARAGAGGGGNRTGAGAGAGDRTRNATGCDGARDRARDPAGHRARAGRPSRRRGAPSPRPRSPATSRPMPRERPSRSRVVGPFGPVLTKLAGTVNARAFLL